MNKKRVMYFSIISVILVISNLNALMPPHITRTVPEDGGVLKGNTVILYGYTLASADLNEITVTDLSTKETIPIKTDLRYTWEGKGRQPGARQQFCTLKIMLEKVTPGHVYEISFLETTIRFTVSLSAPEENQG